GVVYRARDRRLNRVVALKMVLAGAHADAGQLARFQAEAEAVAALRHPNIVQVHEIGTHDGRPYFTLELVPGGSLAARLQGRPPPGWRSGRRPAGSPPPSAASPPAPSPPPTCCWSRGRRCRWALARPRSPTSAWPAAPRAATACRSAAPSSARRRTWPRSRRR